MLRRYAKGVYRQVKSPFWKSKLKISAKDADRDVVQALLTALQSSALCYFTCNLKLDSEDQSSLCASTRFVVQLRDLFRKDENWQFARKINDWNQSTLLLFGPKGTGTHLHCDRTEAKNVAYALQKVCLCVPVLT